MLLAYTKIVNVKGYGQSTSNVCYKEEHSSRYTQIMNRILFDSLRHHGCWSCSAISQDSRQANWGLVKVSSRVNTTKGKLKTGQGYGRTKAIGTVNAHKDRSTWESKYCEALTHEHKLVGSRLVIIFTIGFSIVLWLLLPSKEFLSCVGVFREWELLKDRESPYVLLSLLSLNPLASDNVTSK